MDHFNNTQFELFPTKAQKILEADFPSYKLKDLTLPPENIIVLCIILIMSLVLFFALGVERGKRLAVNLNAQANVVAASQPVGKIEPKVEQPSAAGDGGAGTSAFSQDAASEAKEQAVITPAETPKVIEPRYTVQVASFKSHQTAQKAAKDIQIGDWDTFVMPKGEYAIICVGKFGSADEAKLISNKLKNKFRDNLVRRL